jgi:hypothetical protein
LELDPQLLIKLLEVYSDIVMEGLWELEEVYRESNLYLRIFQRVRHPRVKGT